MKTKFVIILALVSLSQALFAANYVLKIGEETYEISLDESINVQVGNKTLPVKLELKETLTFKTKNFSFQHPNEYTPSKSDLGSDIYQTAMITPLGSVVMIQEYLSLDPTDLIDLMVSELTKEEQEYGYEIESSESSITLSDGKVLGGKVVTSKYKGTDIKRGIYVYGIKDSGLLVVTQFDYEIDANGETLLMNIMDSLEITME